MGNGSSNEGSNVCTGKDAPGLNQYCYTAGYDAGKQNTTPDPVGEGLGAIPCLTAKANACYTEGFTPFNISNAEYV